jgi:hypothetical protein
MTGHPTIDAIGVEYLTLGLELERLVPGFVDAYMGPDDLKTRAHSGPLPDPWSLLDRARRLLTDVQVSAYGDNRKEFLRAQITGLITSCRKLSGEEIPYVEEVESSFDIPVAYTPDDRLDESIRELETALPGQGSVRERQIAYRRRFEVNQQTASKIIDSILNETRDNTRQFLTWPAGENIEIAFVSNQPWSGYNWYLGAARSRVEINTDLPIYAINLPALVAHEAYPGHHTEHALKDQLLYHDRGFAEHAIQLINTPECVISEGIAVLAEDFGFGEQDGAGWLASNLPALAGISLDADVHRRISRASRNLRSVASNAALRFHRDGQSEREVVQYLQHYALATEAEAAKRFSFINDPLWRPYVFTYSVGRELMSAWLDRLSDNTRLDGYRRLLEEQWTPSQLRAPDGP